MPDGSLADIPRRRSGRRVSPTTRTPERAFDLGTDKALIVKRANDIIETCRTSSGIRAAYCRQLNSIIETGRQDGTRSLINKLYRHVDRAASYLYSPDGLRFSVEYENRYPPEYAKRARVASALIRNDFESSDSDLLFGDGVFEALKFGASIFKQWPEIEGEDEIPVYRSSLVMPWQFGVYNESVNDLARQPAMVETVLLTLPEVWRRVYMREDAREIMQRVKSNAQRDQSGDEYNSFFHQVLSTSTLGTGSQGMTHPVPGGIVQLNNDPNYAIVGPTVDAPMVRMHELWLWGQDDYETVQIIEPDIVIWPRLKRGNILGVSGAQPYTVIQPNPVPGYFWGRPEIVDLIEPQGLLSTWAEDGKRLFGLQIDKILAFTGTDGITEEDYAQMRAAGFLNLGPGGGVDDVTPAMPQNFLEMLQFLMQAIDHLGGFSNILSGEGEPGVRAGNHANTLLKTASPSLKKRSLRVERQLAAAADARLSFMVAKDGRTYWTDGDTLETIKATSFRLTDLPDDRRVVVDSHSSSPIFQNDHAALIEGGLKSGLVGGEYAIDNLPFPHKETAKREFREMEEKKAAELKQLAQRDPEAAAKVMSGKR